MNILIFMGYDIKFRYCKMGTFDITTKMYIKISVNNIEYGATLITSSVPYFLYIKMLHLQVQNIHLANHTHEMHYFILNFRTKS